MKLTVKTSKGDAGREVEFTLEQFAGIDEEMSDDDDVWVSLRTEAAGPGFVETMKVMETRGDIHRMISDEIQNREFQRMSTGRPSRRLGNMIDEDPVEARYYHTGRWVGWVPARIGPIKPEKS